MNADWLTILHYVECIRCGRTFEVAVDEMAGFVCDACQFDDWHDEELQEGSEPDEL